MTMRKNGRIVKALSGFYYVRTEDDRIVECRARGIFRKEKITPLAGDRCHIQTMADFKGNIEEILPRKNSFIRPPVANIDRLFIVSSVLDPKPNLYIIDKLSAFAVFHGIEPIVIFSKSDLCIYVPLFCK